MSYKININESVRVYVSFLEYDSINKTYELLDVIDPVGLISKYDSTSESYGVESLVSPIQSISQGLFYYDWTPSSSGEYRFNFTASTTDATPSEKTQDRYYIVGEFTSDSTLSESSFYSFLPELSPLYFDAEKLIPYFESIDLIEATELIYKYSLELESWFGTNLTLTQTMIDYIMAATLCDLSKIYVFGGGLGGFGSSDGFTLGDLAVTRGSGSSNNKNSLYRGNATSWCELASLYREELLYQNVNMKGVVRGSAYDNIVPSRIIKRID